MRSTPPSVQLHSCAQFLNGSQTMTLYLKWKVYHWSLIMFLSFVLPKKSRNYLKIQSSFTNYADLLSFLTTSRFQVKMMSFELLSSLLPILTHEVTLLLRWVIYAPSPLSRFYDLELEQTIIKHLPGSRSFNQRPTSSNIAPYHYWNIRGFRTRITHN